MKNIKWNLFTGVLFFTAGVFSQETISISKEEILQKVSEKNLQLQAADASYQAAKADYRQSNALFLPNVKDRKSVV